MGWSIPRKHNRSLRYGFHMGEWVKVDGGTIYYSDGYMENSNDHIELDPEFDHKWVKAYGSPQYMDAVRAMGCVLCEIKPVHIAHVLSRGAGGGFRDVVPLCYKHHHEQHNTGMKTFQAKYNVDLMSISKLIAHKLDFLVIL